MFAHLSLGGISFTRLAVDADCTFGPQWAISWHLSMWLPTMTLLWASSQHGSWVLRASQESKAEVAWHHYKSVSEATQHHLHSVLLAKVITKVQRGSRRGDIDPTTRKSNKIIL